MSGVVELIGSSGAIRNLILYHFWNQVSEADFSITHEFLAEASIEDWIGRLLVGALYRNSYHSKDIYTQDLDNNVLKIAMEQKDS